MLIFLLNNSYANQISKKKNPYIENLTRLSFVNNNILDMNYKDSITTEPLIHTNILYSHNITNRLMDKTISNFDQDKLYDSKELLLAFNINNVPRNYVDIVLLKNNQVFISEKTIDKFNLKKENVDQIKYYDRNYYRLDQSKINYSIQQATSTLVLIIPPEQFNKTIIEPDNLWHKATVPGVGAYVNYDVLYRYTRKPDVRSFDGLLNTTAFYKQNILTSDFKLNYDKRTNENYDSKELTRLETKFIRDFPDKMLTLTIGDTRSFADLWGNPILMGGIQIATNFDLQPGFVYYPLPDISGVASIPSAVDLYINDTNRQRKNLREGPFEILDIPVVNGSGEIEVIEKDILNREKKYSIPYYLSSFALKPGITQYSLTAGLIRTNFAQSNDRYNKLAVVGNYRTGLTNHLTYGIRGEFKEKQATFGLRSTYSREKYGELNLVSAFSQQNLTQSGSGIYGRLIYINQFARKYNFNLTLDAVSRKYISLGDDPKKLPYRGSLQTFLGIPFGYGSNLTLNYIARDNRNNPSQSLVSVNLNQNIKNLVNITLSSQYDFNNSERKLVFLNFTKSIPEYNAIGSLSSNFETGQKTRYILDLNRAIPEYKGVGYHIRASKKENVDLLADIKYNNQYNSMQLEYNHLNDENNYRASIRGGLAYLNNDFFVSRTISDSFAIIDTNNIYGVNIYHNNRLIAKTNNSGRAIVPQLISFTPNRISLDPSELPLSTNFHNTSLELIPHRNTGTNVSFKAEKNNPVILRLIDKNKKALQTGSHITDTKDNMLTLVGFDGQIYLNLNEENTKKTFMVHWLDGKCMFDLPETKAEADSNIDVINLGDIICS